MKKTTYFMGLVLGLFVVGNFIACASDSESEEEDVYIPIDGERIHLWQNQYRDCAAWYTFINGGKELELTRSDAELKFIPKTIEYKGKEYPITRIGDKSCQAKTITEIPEGVVSIGEYAFEFNKALGVILPNTLKSIGAGAFYINRDLTVVKIPEGVTIIEPSTFAGATALSIVIIHDGITEIKKAAFASTGLETFTIPSRVETIGESAFSFSKLAEVTLDEGVKTIGKKAFYWCEQLRVVSLPKSLTTIEEEAFYGSGIFSITIPENVKFIGNEAFSDGIMGFEPNIKGLDHLEEVTSMIKDPFPITNVFGYNFLHKGTLYVPKGTIEKYKATEGWKDIANIVESD